MNIALDQLEFIALEESITRGDMTVTRRVEMVPRQPKQAIARKKVRMCSVCHRHTAMRIDDRCSYCYSGGAVSAVCTPSRHTYT